MPKTPSPIPPIVIATLIQIVATATVLAASSVAPLVARDLGIGAYWIGYQVSLIYFAGVFSSAVAGTLVLRHGPIVIEQVVLATFIIGFLGFAGGSIGSVIIGSIATGIGYGLNNPASSHILNAVAPKAWRNLIYSIKQAGVPVGAVVASLAFPSLAEVHGWRVTFSCAALVPAVLLALLFLRNHAIVFARDPKAPFGGNFLFEQRLVWRTPSLRALAIIGFLYSAVQLSLSAFVVTMLVQDAGWSLIAAGSIAAAMQAGGAFGRVFWGVVADRIGGGFLVLALIGVITGTLGAAIYWIPNYPALVQIAILVGLGVASIGWNGVLLAETARHAPAGLVGPMTGAVLVYIFLGVMVGPASFAALYALTHHYGIAFAAFGILASLATFAAAQIHVAEVRKRTGLATPA